MSTPWTCPTSMKLTDNEPEGGGEAPPVALGLRPQAGARRSRNGRSSEARRFLGCTGLGLTTVFLRG